MKTFAENINKNTKHKCSKFDLNKHTEKFEQQYNSDQVVWYKLESR